MLYFAYGSNMEWHQMRTRCPSAKFVGVAVLGDHRIAFSRASKKRRCGVAGAVYDAGKEIWGAVYEIDDRDIGSLDLSEGYQPGRGKNSYQREQRHVYLDDDLETPLSVEVYFAIPEPDPPLPDQEYKDLILAGARFWHLPEDYIRDVIERIEVQEG